MKEGDLSWLVGELRELAGHLDAEQREAPLLLAIDQGGHASRALAFDLEGTLHAESYAPISSYRPRADRVEHDANEVAASIRTCLADLEHTLQSNARRVIAAGLATQRSSIVCWDKRTLQPLTPVLSWQDRRNAAFIEQLQSRAADVRSRTGLVLSPHYGASKLRWCLDNVPSVQEAAQSGRLRLGPLASFLLNVLLSGRPYVVDPANASRTLLWDPRTQAWAEDLARMFGVPIALLPQPVFTRSVYGELAFGDRQLPLLVCTGDQSAVPFAFGSFDDATVYLNLGTGAFMQRRSRGVGFGDAALLESVVYSDDSGSITVQEGTVNGAASALDWLNERVGIDTHRAALAMTSSNIAADAPLFLNGVGGLGSPYWKPGFETRFDAPASEALQVQAVLESIGFLIAANLERMSERTTLKRIVVSGGLSQCEYLCEIIAALVELEVVRTEVREATARGLAYLVAGRPAVWGEPGEAHTFVPRPKTALTARYRRWIDAMREAGAT